MRVDPPDFMIQEVLLVVASEVASTQVQVRLGLAQPLGKLQVLRLDLLLLKLPRFPRKRLVVTHKQLVAAIMIVEARDRHPLASPNLKEVVVEDVVDAADLTVDLILLHFDDCSPIGLQPLLVLKLLDILRNTTLFHLFGVSADLLQFILVFLVIIDAGNGLKDVLIDVDVVLGVGEALHYLVVGTSLREEKVRL